MIPGLKQRIEELDVIDEKILAASTGHKGVSLSADTAVLTANCAECDPDDCDCIDCD